MMIHAYTSYLNYVILIWYALNVIVINHSQELRIGDHINALAVAFKYIQQQAHHFITVKNH